MKIYSVFNSRGFLLANFTDKQELLRFIRRHSRDVKDTTILQTIANSWNETNEIWDISEAFCTEAYSAVT